MLFNDELNRLIWVLPKPLQAIIINHKFKGFLVEIVMDFGCRPEARFLNHSEYLSLKPITWDDLQYSLKRLTPFSDNNRAGVEFTLHRISCIRNRQGLIIGLTFRVGRFLFGLVNVIRDLLETKNSLLILGKPGNGKTTIVREIVRILANEMEQRVVIIDTSNEIAGTNDITHFCVGRARRMQVKHRKFQHKIMIEAVENHMPNVVVVDEIGTALEVDAIQTIAERGVQVIGTAHGNDLHNLIQNPILSNLVGGIESVTLSDDEARRRGTQKTILERKNLPVFKIVFETNDHLSWKIHENVEKSVDLILKGRKCNFQTRKRISESHTNIFSTEITLNSKLIVNFYNFWKPTSLYTLPNSLKKNIVLNYIFFSQHTIYLYRIPNSFMKEIFETLPFKFLLTNDINLATSVLGYFNSAEEIDFFLKGIKSKFLPIFIIKNFSSMSIKLALRKIFLFYQLFF